jgi:anti-sigma factor RsiW
MATKHPETELVPYLSGGLSADDRIEVERHLKQCAQCRESAESSAAILSQLSKAVDEVRPPDWVAYRAELHSKLRTTQIRQPGVLKRWRQSNLRLPAFGWPSLAMGAALGAALVFVLVMHRGARLQAPGVDQLELQEELTGADVGMLANYPVVQHLDLLENYDVIEHLDELAPEDRQSNETPS